MKLAVVGSRGVTDKELIWNEIDSYIKEIGEPCGLIISGGARGVDSIAEVWADAHGVQKSIWLADWDKFGKSAGYRRNMDIVAESTHVLAIYDGQSKGTMHSIKLATDKGKQLKVVVVPSPTDQGEKK